VTAPVLPADDPAAIARAAALLRRGGLVAFPTETVYGLGASAFDARAVARVFAAKARPSFDPLIVHVSDASELPRVAVADDPRVARLAAHFWPGPLTLVLPRRPEVPDIVTSGLDTVGVRVPSHPAARALLRAAGPLAAPSANPFGYVSPTTAAHVAERLGDAVDLVLDGGPCPVGVESTILSLVTEPASLLRPGGVPREDLEAVLGHALALARAASDRSPRVSSTPTTPRTRRCAFSTVPPPPCPPAPAGWACWPSDRARHAATRRWRCCRPTAASPRPLRGSSPRCAASTRCRSTPSTPSPVRPRGSASRSWTGSGGRRPGADGPQARRDCASSTTSRSHEATAAGSEVKRTATVPSGETWTTLA